MTGPATAADLHDLLRLWSDTFPELIPPELSTAVAEGRVVALRGPSGLVGAAVCGPAGEDPRERLLTVVAGAADAWLEAEAAATGGPLGRGVDRWHVTVREDSALVVAGLQRAGYAVTGRSWGAQLDAEDVDVDAAHRRVEAAAACGFVLRQLGSGDAAAAHRLVQECRADFPASPATPAPDLGLDEVTGFAAGPGRAAFGVTAPAAQGRRLVAVTLLEVDDDGRSADTELTAVAADHRGRGLATALKALAVVVLLSRGVRTFRTGGAAVAEASLRANRALGYRLEPQWLTWTRAVGPAP
ncbi:GNAT family N-acetyltransferase [Streptomyces sp. NP160]|uniref:GNAT family N-acetyltransferase n=1 Tax=Streptomyces sp. NP160 TaxID=2586637 RepID=UPI00111986B0|nr:GNAT family N-acetyltransferase [Streptomyces sp. NP160]TNM67188.1 GNAT family N-acetyltransferase [Streptomyces sp. NP160]